MTANSLDAILARELPALRPSLIDDREHEGVFDATSAAWIRMLAEDCTHMIAADTKPRKRPLRVGVAAVDRRSDEQYLPKAAERDAYCLLDAATSDAWSYWVLLHRSLIHDLYFMLAAIELGPARFVTDAGASKSYVDVSAPSFLVGGEAERPKRLAAIAVEFVFLHELAHAHRGHIPYLRAAGSSDLRALCEIGAAGDSPVGQASLCQAIETDADLIALGIQMHLLSQGKHATRLISEADPEAFASDLGFVLGMLFRLFELWRRSKNTRPFDASAASHPHPDVREVVCDAWLRQRTKEAGVVNGKLCSLVRAGHDAGREALQRLGPEFLPSVTYLTTRGNAAITAEVTALMETLEGKVRPELASFDPS